MNNQKLAMYDGNNHQPQKPDKANAGLWFARFYDGYFVDDKETAKQEFLKKFISFQGNKALLEKHCQRQIALAEATAGDVRVYALDGHFVTGMGNAHPVENGFQWHYTLGVPYLAGSQIKGIVRSMIERYFDGSNQDKAALLLQWFGSTDKKPTNADPQQAGELIFFDALPYERPTLTIDVMTPHMGQWYAAGDSIQNKDEDKIPADWHDPIPVPFLSVKDAKFVLCIGKRPGSNIDLTDVWQVLDQALSYLGAGGKTHTGMGYMKYEPKRTEVLYQNWKEYQQEKSQTAAFAAAQAQASDFHRELLAIAHQEAWRENNEENKQRFTKALTSHWLTALEAHPEETDSIRLITDIARQHYPKQMKDPEGKKVKPNQREWIKRLLALDKNC